MDGASNLRRYGVVIFILTQIRGLIEQCICLDFQSTNNVAEYEALI